MTQDDNVVKLPDLLERQAKRILAGLAKDSKVRSEWIEIQLEKADAIATAKGQFPNTTKFGEWCSANGFGPNVLNEHDRAALVAFGEDLPRARTVLEKTDRWSLKHIHLNEFRLVHMDKSSPPPPPPPKTSVVREEVKDIIRAHREQHGVYPSIAEVTKESKRSRIVAEPALAAVIAEDTVAPQTFTFTKAQDKQVEARLKVLEAQFNERVRLTMLERNKDYLITLDQIQKEASEKAYHYGQMINNHNPIFTEEEFRTIIICLHPDNSASKEKRDTAFKAVQARKLQLTGKK